MNRKILLAGLPVAVLLIALDVWVGGTLRGVAMLILVLSAASGLQWARIAAALWIGVLGISTMLSGVIRGISAVGALTVLAGCLALWAASLVYRASPESPAEGV